MFDRSIARIKKTELYDEYIVYCNQNNIKPRDKIRCYRTLEDINIIPKKIMGYWYYTVSLDKLKEIANKYHWLNGIDDEEQCVGNNFSFARNDTDTKYEELMKENYELSEQLKANKDVNILNEELMKKNHELSEQLKTYGDVNRLNYELSKQTKQIMIGFERLIRQNEAAKCEINQLKNKLTSEQLEQLEQLELQQLLDQTEQTEQTEQQPEQQPKQQPEQQTEQQKLQQLEQLEQQKLHQLLIQTEQTEQQPKQQSENIDFRLERIKKRKRKHKRKKVIPDQDEIDDMFDFSNISSELKTPIVEDKKHSKAHRSPALPEQTKKKLIDNTDEILTKTVISENGEMIGFSPVIC